MDRIIKRKAAEDIKLVAKAAYRIMRTLRYGSSDETKQVLSKAENEVRVGHLATASRILKSLNGCTASIRALVGLLERGADLVLRWGLNAKDIIPQIDLNREKNRNENGN